MKVSFYVPVDILKNEEQLLELKAAGLKYLAVPYQALDLPDEEIIALRERFARLGLVVDTIHLPFNSGYNPTNSVCTNDEDVRLATVAMWKRYMSRFPLIGGVRVTPMHTGGCMQTYLPEKNVQQLTKTLEALLPLAEEIGTIIALENTFFCDPPVCYGPEGEKMGPYPYLNDNCKMLAKYAAGWKSPYIALCHDVGHSNLFGHNVDTDLVQMLPLTHLYHFHDNGGKRDDHRMPGLGTIDWFSFVKALRTVEYDEPMYCELLHSPIPGQSVSTLTNLKNDIICVNAFLDTLAGYVDTQPRSYPLEHKVLCVGNSFGADCTRYLEDVCDGRVLARNAFIGGCSLERHVSNIDSDEKEYLYHHDALCMKMVSLKEALTAEDWDTVVVHQASPVCGVDESYEPYLTQLLAYIRKLAPHARILMNETWAYEVDSTHVAFPTYHCNQQEMFLRLRNAYTTHAAEHSLPLIPTGDVIQCLRGTPAFNHAAGAPSINRDGFHLSYDYGRYAAALTWAKAICGVDPHSVTFAPANTDPETIALIKDTVAMF